MRSPPSPLTTEAPKSNSTLSAKKTAVEVLQHYGMCAESFQAAAYDFRATRRPSELRACGSELPRVRFVRVVGCVRVEVV